MATADPALDGPLRPALRTRLAEHGIDRALVLLAPALLLMLALFAYPFIYGLQLSLHPQQGSGAFANYRSFFSDPYQRDTIFTTLKLALPATAINVLASIPIAYRMRAPFRGRRLLSTILVIPVTLGTVLVAEGLLRYLGPRGWLNRVLLKLGVISHPLQLTHNYVGVLLSLVITGFPFCFLLILSYMSGIDPTLERAASTLGAGPWNRFRRITLPLLAPGLATTFVLGFVLAFSVFPSAILVGEPSLGTRVISIAAYHAAFENYDYSMGSAIAIVMGAVELAVIAVVLTGRARLYRGPSTGGKG
jgi:putative spermidine/putrescine transport system permease protein